MSYPDAKGLWVTTYPDKDQPAQVLVESYAYGAELIPGNLRGSGLPQSQMPMPTRIIMTMRIIQLEKSIVFPMVWSQKMPNAGLIFWMNGIFDTWENEVDDDKVVGKRVIARYTRVEGKIFGPDPLPHWHLFGFPKLPSRYTGLSEDNSYGYIAHPHSWDVHGSYQL